MSDEGQFSLLPVEALSRDEQLELLAVRNQGAIRENSFNSHIIREAEHFAWIADVASDPDTCFYAFCRGTQIMGGIGLKNIDAVGAQAEWSFYLSEMQHGKGLGLRMAAMALDFFFDQMALVRVVGETLPANEISHNFHRRLGFVDASVDVFGRPVAQRDEPVAVFELTDTAWHKARPQILGLGPSS